MKSYHSTHYVHVCISHRCTTTWMISTSSRAGSARLRCKGLSWAPPSPASSEFSFRSSRSAIDSGTRTTTPTSSSARRNFPRSEKLPWRRSCVKTATWSATSRDQSLTSLMNFCEYLAIYSCYPFYANQMFMCFFKSSLLYSYAAMCHSNSYMLKFSEIPVFRAARSPIWTSATGARRSLSAA